MSDKPIALPVPAMGSIEHDTRGGAAENALADFRRRLEQHQPPQTGPIDAAYAARRRQLISEMYAMDRATPNVALESIITGGIAGTAVQVIVYGLRLWFDSRKERRVVDPIAKTPPATGGENKTLVEAGRPSVQLPPTAGDNP